MNDVQYCLKQDTKDRKAIGRNAKYRVVNKKGRCRLPSDNLTAAQRKKLNGECITMKLNELISYQDFKRLTRTMQREYLQNLEDRYKPRMKDVAIAMDVAPNSMSSYIRKYHEDFRFTNIKNSPSKAWLDFMNGTIEEDVVEEAEVEEEITETETESKEEYNRTLVNANHGKVSFVGDPYAVFAKAVNLFDKEKYYNITISFRVEE